MNQIRVGIAISLIAFGFIGSSTSRAADDEAAKELKRIEGVWASTPAKKGRDRSNLLVFQGGRMGWRSFQTQDGEPLIGHAELYNIQLDAKASPKQITATWGEGEDKKTLRGIYEIDGDTLKIAFGSGLDAERPKKFEDDRPIILTRDKKAKLPDLWQVEKPKKETLIEPRDKWLGGIDDAAIEKQCPKKPIITQAEFEKLWKLLRGKEEMPKVDFAKEFVIVETSDTFKIEVHSLLLVEGDERVSTYEESTGGEKFKGFTYFIGVFRREQVDVVDGRMVIKSPKK